VSPETKKGVKRLFSSWTSVFIYRRSNSSSNSLRRKTPKSKPRDFYHSHKSFHFRIFRPQNLYLRCGFVLCDRRVV